jgi:phage terminase small subunit
MPTPRKPLSEHALQNTRPQYVEPSSDVLPGRPKFPKNFTPEQKQTFKRICKLLASRRTCTAGDVEIIRLLCIAIDRQNRALVHIAEEGEIAPYTRLDSNGAAHTFYKIAKAQGCGLAATIGLRDQETSYFASLSRSCRTA